MPIALLVQTLVEIQQRKKCPTDYVLFGVHLTMLGAFATIIGYLALACHHLH